MSAQDQLDQITERLEPNALSLLIYRYFFNGPIGGAKTRLAKIIKNHLLGLPIMSFAEVLDEYLVQTLGLNASTDPTITAVNDRVLKTERALFWKALNGVGDPGKVDRLIAYAEAKELTECITETILRRKPAKEEPCL